MKIPRTLLFLTLLLFACSPVGLSPEPPPPTLPNAPIPNSSPVSASEAPTVEIIPGSTTESLPPPKLIATVSTPHIDQGPDGAPTLDPSYPRNCGYQWAYQDLPELSEDFLQSIQALQTEAQANTFAFGEDCVYEDGSKTFIPMETDFNITLHIDDLTNEEMLGEWIVKVMQVIENIPHDQIIGPRPGRVSITFESNGQKHGFSFYIDQYQALGTGMSNIEIYQALSHSQ